MAHKGKLFAVAFRRDFNLNVENNNDGWGHRYLLFLGDLGTGLAAFWKNTHWELPQVTSPLVNSLLWESEHVLKFGLHWYTQFQVTITGGVQLIPLFRLVTEEFGLILEVTYAEQRRPVTSAATGINPQITYWDPAAFDQEPVGALGSTWRPKFWADGAPY